MMDEKIFEEIELREKIDAHYERALQTLRQNTEVKQEAQTPGRGIEFTVLESIAHVLGKDAKYNLSHASMIATDLARELNNYLPHETVNEFFLMFAEAKRREGR